jgi:hypothetical protein
MDFHDPELVPCEELTRRRQGAKARRDKLLCFLCTLCDFAPLREMLLLVQGFFLPAADGDL